MEWLWWLIVSALTIIPMWRLCERAGMNPLWSLLCVFPPLLVVLLWVLAYRDPGGVA
jgi:hypothetical protein